MLGQNWHLDSASNSLVFPLLDGQDDDASLFSRRNRITIISVRSGD